MSSCEPELSMSDDYKNDSEKYSHVIKKLGTIKGGSSKANQFEEMRKFLDSLAKQVGADTIVSLGKAKSVLKEKNISEQQLESLYHKSTGKHLTADKIIQKMEQLQQILHEIALENQQIYGKLSAECEKYLLGIGELKELSNDVQITEVLEKLSERFKDVRNIVEFAIQKTLKVKPLKADYTTYNLDDSSKDFFKFLLQLSSSFENAVVSKKDIVKKFFEKIVKTLHTDPKNEQNSKLLFKLISKIPILVSSPLLDAKHFKTVIKNACTYVFKTQDVEKKEQFIQKLNLLFKKLMDKQGTDNLSGKGKVTSRSVFKQISQQNYIKDQRIQIFKSKMNNFIVNIIKQFFLLIDEKTIKEFQRIDMDLKPVLIELQDVYTQLVDNRLEMTQLVNMIRQQTKERTLEYEGVLYRLNSLVDTLTQIKEEIKNEKFQEIIQEIIRLVQKQYQYLYKIIHETQYTDISSVLEEDLLKGSGYLDDLDEETIYRQFQENRQYIDIITNFIVVSQMQKNLHRVKKEINTINEKRYYEDLTVETLKDTLQKCEQYYDNIETFYKNIGIDEMAETRYNPYLAEYLYHITLRFQSCSYISKGFSSDPMLNPRYYLNAKDAAGEPVALPLDESETTPSNEIKSFVGDRRMQHIHEEDNHILKDNVLLKEDGQHINSSPLTESQWFLGSQFTYARWYYNPKSLGIIEELDAKRQKFFSKTKITKNIDDQLPVQPTHLKLIEQHLKDDKPHELTPYIYTNMANNCNTFDLISNHPIIAKQHLQQLLTYWSLIGNPDPERPGQKLIKYDDDDKLLKGENPLEQDGTGLNINNYLYTFATSNPFSILRFERPSIVGRLLQRRPEDVRWKLDIDKDLISNIIQKLHQNSVVKLDNDLRQFIDNQGEKKAYLSLSDAILSEYLIPEIQIPFIGPTLQDQGVKIDDITHDKCQKMNIMCSQQDEDPKMQTWREQYEDLMLNQYSTAEIEQNNICITNQRAVSNLVYTNRLTDDRILFDDIEFYDNKHIKGLYQFDTDKVLPCTSMFGQLSVMPLYSSKNSKVGCLLDASQLGQVEKIRVKYSSQLNCFFDSANVVKTRDYHGKGAEYDANDVDKRNSIFFAYDKLDSNHPQYACGNSSCPVYKSNINKTMEYQLHMAQHLQYFTVAGSRLIFDPLVRKQMFQTFNTIYRGDDLLFEGSGLDRDIFVNQEEVGDERIQRYRSIFDNPSLAVDSRVILNPSLRFDKDLGQRWYVNHPYLTLGRTFGNPVLRQNYYAKVQGNHIAGEVRGDEQIGFQRSVGRITYQYLPPTNQHGLFPENADTLGEYYDIKKIWIQDNGIVQVMKTAMVDDYQHQPYFSNFQKLQQTQKGLLQVPDEYILNQPKISLGVTLRDAQDPKLRKKFIQEVMKVDPEIIKDDVLKVNEQQLKQLQQVLAQNDAQGGYFRIYLSECIKLQYFSNHEVLKRTDPLDGDKYLNYNDIIQVSKNGKEVFDKLVKDVISIKKKGYLSLLSLAELIDVYLGAQTKNIANHSIKLEDIKDMLAKLYIHYRKTDQQDPTGQFANFRSRACLNANQYLRIYSQNSGFSGSFTKSDRSRLFGGLSKQKVDRYKFDVTAYYEDLGKYINEMKQKIDEDTVVSNFVRMFSLICQKADENSQLISVKPGKIERYIKNYLLASCVEIDTSLMQTDFSLNLLKDSKQVEFVMDKKMKLIGIDAIYIPQNWKLSDSFQNTTLVPHAASECTRDLDMLYNNILNAMSQKLVNILGLYRMQIKKKNDIQLTRVLLGAKKRSKSNRSFSQQLDRTSALQSMTLTHPQKALVLKRKEFDMKRFELYFRVILICNYYSELFNKKNQKFANILYIPTDETRLEGQLLKLFLTKDSDSTPQGMKVYTNRNIETIIEKIEQLCDYYNVKESANHIIYEKLVEYVNTNYGVINSDDYKKLKSQQEEYSKDVSFSINRKPLFAIEDEDDDPLLQDSSLLKINQDLIKRETPSPLDLMATKQLIQQQIDEISKVVDDSNTLDNSLVKIFRTLRYELSNSSREKKIEKLIHMLNRKNSYRDGSEQAILVHEQILFAFAIFNQFHILTKFMDTLLSDCQDSKLKQCIETAYTSHTTNQSYQKNHQVVDLIFNDISPQSKPDKDIPHIYDKKYQVFSDILSILLDDHLIEIIPNYHPLSGHSEDTHQKEFTIDSSNLIVYLRSLFNITTQNIQIHGKTYDKVKKTVFQDDDIQKTIDNLKQQKDQIEQFFKKFATQERFTGRGADDLINMDQSKDQNDKYMDYDEFLVQNNGYEHVVVKESKHHLDKPRSQIVQEQQQLIQQDKQIPKSIQQVMDQPLIQQVDVREEIKKLAEKIHTFSPNQKIGGNENPYKLMFKVGGMTPKFSLTELLKNSNNQRVGDIKDTKIYQKEKVIGQQEKSIPVYVIYYKYPFKGNDAKTPERFKLPEQLDTDLRELQQYQEYTEANTINAYLTYNKDKNALQIVLSTLAPKLVEQNASKENFQGKSLQGGKLPSEQQSFKHTRNMPNGYTTYTLFDNHYDDVFVFNKILKQLIQNTSILSAVPKVFSRIFQGIWGQNSSSNDLEMIYKYEEVHNDKRKIKEKVKEYRNSGPHDYTVTQNMNKQIILDTGNKLKQYVKYNELPQHNKRIVNEVISRITNLVNTDNWYQNQNINYIKDIILEDIEDNVADSDFLVTIIQYLDNQFKDIIIQQNIRSAVDVQRLVNPVRRNEMIEGLLYDGYDERIDEFNIQEILMHNEEQKDKLGSLFTSSVINFAAKLLQASQSLPAERSKFGFNIEAQELLTIDSQTEKALICSCVDTSFQLQCLIQKLSFKLKAQESVAFQVYNNSELHQEGMTIEELKEQLLRQVNFRINHINQLKQVVYRVKQRIDDFVDTKKHMIPKYMSEDTETSIEKPLYSNFFHLINLQDLDENLVRPLSRLEQHVFCRYKYIRTLGDGERQVYSDLVKSLDQNTQESFIRITEPLIWYLTQVQTKLKNSVINVEGIQQEIYFMNPPKDITNLKDTRDYKLPYWIQQNVSQFVQQFTTSKYAKKFSTININDDQYPKIYGHLKHEHLTDIYRHLDKFVIQYINKTDTLSYNDSLGYLESLQPTICKSGMNKRNLIIQTDDAFKTLDKTMQAKNPQIFEQIIMKLIQNQKPEKIEIFNFVDLGLLPLNLNMMKKDVGLFNIVFNAGLYRKFVNNLAKPSDDIFQKFTREETSTLFKEYLQKNGLLSEEPGFGLLQGTDNVKSEEGSSILKDKRHILSLITAQDIIGQQLGKYRSFIKQRLDNDTDIGTIVTKQDEYDIAMNFRLNFGMYLLSTYMLGKTSGDDQVIQGIEAVINHQSNQQ